MKPDEDQEEMLVTYTLMQKKRPLTKFEEDLGVSSEYENVSQTNDGLCQLMSLYHISASLYQNGESVLKDLIASKNGNSDFHLLHC